MSRVCYVVFTSGAVSGTGVLTRAEAVARAFTARHTGGIDFQIFGTADRESVPEWLTTVKASEYLFNSLKALINGLIEFKPDILLVDSYPGNLISYLQSKDRPPNVWGVMRHTPGALGKYRLEDSLRGVFDRLYQIEPSNHGLNSWDISLTRERTRSIAQLEAGTKDINYQEPPPKDASEFVNWQEHYRRHAQGSRKLIAPIVNVEPDRILPRLEARKALLEFAELDPKEAKGKKPLALVAMTAGRTVGNEFVRSRKWQGQLFIQWGLYDLPEDERLFVQVMPNAPKIPELWRYLAGVDYFIGSCGYNTFYEVRYVKALGLFNGKAAFWPMANYQDQTWRADNQARLFNGELYPHGLNPVENGADYIVTAILAKLGNYSRPEPQPKSLIETILEEKRKRAKAMLDKVYEIIKEVWECENNLKEIPPAERNSYRNKNEWYAMLLQEYITLAEAPVSNKLAGLTPEPKDPAEVEAIKARVEKAKQGLALLEGK